MPKNISKEITSTNLLEFMATKAWREIRPEVTRPDKIEVLKGRKETARRSACRLVGVGPENSSIIAKRCRRAKALIERMIYEEVLPSLPTPTLRYYGFVEEADGKFCWLFLEDAGEERYLAFAEEHRRAAGRWLGLLHTSAAHSELAAQLPDRGPQHYLERLRSARDRILENLTNPALKADDLAVLEAILSQCEVLESGWDRMERLCHGMPRTVVHGDFVGKNMRLRTNEAGIVLLPFDWGNAGWGFPAIDLAQSPLPSFDFTGNPNIAAYWTVVRDHWPSVDVQTIQQWANLATILRILVAINWDALSLGYEWVERPMIWMRLYQAAMAYAMRAADWLG